MARKTFAAYVEDDDYEDEDDNNDESKISSMKL